MMLRRFSNIAIVLGFALIAGIPLLSFSSAHWSDPREGRASVNWPRRPHTMADLLAYSTTVEAFVNDHIGQRKRLLDLRSQIDFGLFTRSPTSRVLLGRNDWLFYTGEKSVEDYRGQTPFSEAEFDRWDRDLKMRQDYAKSQGVLAYQFVVAPNKQSIYPEYMPDGIVRAPRNYFDELSLYLARKGEQSKLNDLRPTLLPRKGDSLLYHPIDTHWNRYGAYFAYRAIIDRLVADGVKNLAGVDLPEKLFAPGVMDSGDLSRMMGVDRYPRPITTMFYVGPALKCQTHEVPLEPMMKWTNGGRVEPDAVSDCDSAGNHLRVLVLQDSMVLAMRDYLANSFAHVRFVWLVPTSFDDIKMYIEQEHPDIVIEERVERRLNEPLVSVPVVEATLSPSPPPAERGGWVEQAQDGAGTVAIDGWARWQSNGDRRTIFVNTNLPVTGMTLSEYPRPDVSAAEYDDRLIRSGFHLRLNVDPSKPRPEVVRLCIWTEDPVFGPRRLGYVNGGDWDTCPAS